MAAEYLAPKRRVDDKPESWRPNTWPQKGDYKPTTNLSHGGRKLGSKKVDDKHEPWWPKTWPQKGDGCNRSPHGYVFDFLTSCFFHQ
ncbi:MAG: hypothetical protein DRR08_11615 [Candidatus Parabeggiatoa sp. nov. 2]|nr:MAG: hypothetical protein B6247_06660 [Beggiatoa sp. 4572_84]RKZ60317.1 MAG: hypothetical protein DRR08_11615 [Gammaproteobacteria bacterium]